MAAYETAALIITIPDDVLLDAGCERLPRELTPLCGWFEPRGTII